MLIFVVVSDCGGVFGAYTSMELAKIRYDRLVAQKPMPGFAKERFSIQHVMLENLQAV